MAKRQLALPAPNREPLPEFLRPADLGKLGATANARILTARAQRAPKYGPCVIVDLKIGADRYSLSVDTDTSNYAILYEKFGADPAKWTGTVKLENRKSERAKSGLTVVVLR